MTTKGCLLSSATTAKLLQAKRANIFVKAIGYN